jgi:ABC-type Fe3+ transport system permease subunit
MDGIYSRQEVIPDNGTTGTHSDTSTLVSALVSTLAPTLVAAVTFLAVFLMLREKKKNAYRPRTYLDVLAGEYLPVPGSLLGLGMFANDSL